MKLEAIKGMAVGVAEANRDNLVALVELAIAGAVREARREALEEAMGVIRAQCEEKGTGCLAHCTHYESIAAVRSLIDSQEEK